MSCSKCRYWRPAEYDLPERKAGLGKKMTEDSRSVLFSTDFDARSFSADLELTTQRCPWKESFSFNGCLTTRGNGLL
jgi:hypothetical protein